MKRIITFTAVLSGLVAYAQDTKLGRVGINTTTPQATLEIAKKEGLPITQNQGVIFPKLTTEERNQWKDVKESTMFYNTTKKCIDLYDGEKWACADGKQVDYVPVNPITDPSKKAQLWDRTYYIGSFNHLGTGKIVDGKIAKPITLLIAYNDADTGINYTDINVVRTVTDRNGTKKILTLNIPKGTINDKKGFLNATIKVGSGGINDKFDVPYINANQEQTITEFNFALNGRPATVKLIASGGVKDKKYDQKTPGTDNLDHQFVYLPVSAYPTDTILLPDSGAPYERTWLNNNLGAEYANVASTVITNFDPTQQATVFNYDDNACGYLYEWRRDSDGHEVIKWGSEGYILKYTFAYPNKHNYDYNQINGINPKTGTEGDPCPTGYRTMSKSDGYGLFDVSENSWAMWDPSKNQLHLPFVCQRSQDRNDIDCYGQGSTVLYWLWDDLGGKESDATAISRGEGYDFWRLYKTMGLPVRCIKN